MEPIIASLVRRNMKYTSAFTRADEKGRTPPISIQLEAGESLIGWYRNPPPWEESFLFFSTIAIYSCDNGDINRILLSEIVAYESPTDINGTGLQIRTLDGFRFLRIAGSYGPDNKFKDIFSLMMVLKMLTGQ